jgi:hypothetical protein
MNRFSIIAALVAFAIFATLLMFLTALIIHALGSTAIFFVWVICVPVECVLLCSGLAVMFVTQANVIHSLRLKREDEEHHYQVLQEKREIELEMRKLQLQLYRRRLSKGIHLLRRPKLRSRTPENLSENGC